jgi:ABC-2 type transport system permease protein
MTLAPYRALFGIAFKNSFAYRAAVVTGVVGSLFLVLTQIAVWTYVFRRDPAMIRYMTCYVVLADMLRLLLGNQVAYGIGWRVQNGDFARDLVRPASSMFGSWCTCFGDTVAGVLTRGVPVLVVFLPAFFSAGVRAERLPLFLAAVVLSVTLYGILYVLLAHVAFVVLDLSPFIRFLDDTIRLFAGTFVPIAFFPPFLRTVAQLLPFQYLYSFPIRVLIEDIGMRELLSSFAVLLAWIAAFAAAIRVASARAIRKIVVQGG